MAGVFNHAVAVSPDDSNDLADTADALWVGGVGNVKAVTAGGDTVTFTAVAAGTLLPVRVTRVFSTLTTATLIYALRIQ